MKWGQRKKAQGAKRGGTLMQWRNYNNLALKPDGAAWAWGEGGEVLAMARVSTSGKV